MQCMDIVMHSSICGIWIVTNNHWESDRKFVHWLMKKVTHTHTKPFGLKYEWIVIVWLREIKAFWNSKLTVDSKLYKWKVIYLVEPEIVPESVVSDYSLSLNRYNCIVVTFSNLNFKINLRNQWSSVRTILNNWWIDMTFYRPVSSVLRLMYVINVQIW